MNITEHNTLELNNVLSYRGKITPRTMPEVIENMNLFIRSEHAKKKGPVVTATYGMELENGDPVADVEILIPMDKKINSSSEYSYKPIFKLCDAVKLRHCGAPEQLQSSADELMGYIHSNHLQPITTGYNIAVSPSESSSDLIVDMYVGVSRNVL